MTSDLPEPLSPPDCDLRGYDFMPLFGQRLFGSAFYSLALTNPRAGLAGMKLWWEAWLQRPAGSLPAASQISATRSYMAKVRALRACGRLKVTWPMPSRTS